MEKKLMITHDETGDVLNVYHNAGLFSCCSVRLNNIIDYFNKNKKEPRLINCKSQFIKYKINPYDENEDLNPLFFEDYFTFDKIKYVNKIIYEHEFQFMPYKTINYNNLMPFVNKYFTPSKYIFGLIEKLNIKYGIDYKNTIGVFYRGNDKHGETNISSYDVFFDKCSQILKNDINYRFLLQTDEKEFLEEFYKRFPNTFHLEEIPQINQNKNISVEDRVMNKHRPEFGKLFISIIYMISKCEHIITNSGNCGIWITLFRGGVKNVHQFLHHHNSNINWF